MLKEYPHGIMFHHFHDLKDFLPQQGSISAEEFYNLIYILKKNYNILSASEFYYKALNNTLHSNDIVLTFDDNLKCQYYVAKPVLAEFNITAFWFINTLSIELGYNLMDVFRYFRNSFFKNIKDFYSVFFEKSKKMLSDENINQLNSFNPKEYIPECPFYTDDDRRFKFLRDTLLSIEQYNKIMFQLMNDYNFNYKGLSLWMCDCHLKKLLEEGHIIGLHSHSHSMCMEKMCITEQIIDYQTNYKILKNILQTEIYSVSYPCGFYSLDLLCELSKIGITLGFIDYYDHRKAKNNFLFPREDHSNLISHLRSHK